MIQLNGALSAGCIIEITAAPQSFICRTLNVTLPSPALPLCHGNFRRLLEAHDKMRHSRSHTSYILQEAPQLHI
jgi:hypothetical protein